MDEYPSRPLPVLYGVHIAFGVVGYALLGYCLVGWLRGRSRSVAVRLAFLGIWTPAYAAGVVMAAS